MMLRFVQVGRRFSTQINPLLREDSASKLPPFKTLSIEHFRPAFDVLIQNYASKLSALETEIAQSTELTWNTVMTPLEKNGAQLSHTWSILGHLMSVQNSPELREIHQELQPAVMTAIMKQNHSKVLYDAYKRLEASPTTNAVEKRILEQQIRAAELSGVACEGEEKKRFEEIQLRLNQLSTEFSNNVLDSTKAFSILVTDKKQLDGVPDSTLELAAANARADGYKEATGRDGPWKLTLDAPCLFPILTYCSNRTLRREMYCANLTRASGDGEWSNEEIINEILALRQEKAKLIGFNSYAELSIASKMAPNVDAVETLMIELRDKCIGSATKEIQALRDFATQNGHEESLELWDVGYWAERRRAELFSFSDEQLRPYFPLSTVLSGLFDLSERLFGITIRPADGKADVWHPDVQFYTIENQDGQEIASFFLDPYSRPENKNGGAWMNTCLSRSAALAPSDEAFLKPVAYLICNQSPPTEKTESLMTFREVETLFHEFGHGLQHMLTQVPYAEAAGINGVEWDATELPSQFMENFCYDRDTIRSISRHIQTSESLPDTSFDQIVAAKSYMAGSAMLRQIYFSVLDLRLHDQYDPSRRSVFDFQKELARGFTILPPLDQDRFLCSFSHIFAGGYAAGYYSYKWAEVLSCDAYDAFENVEDISVIGRRFRDTVLSLGGSVPPTEVFKAFRGRSYRTDAMLRAYGLQ